MNFIFALLLTTFAHAELHTLTVELPAVALDQPYPAMEGPFKNVVVPLDLTKPYVLVNAKLEILNNGKSAPQFLCHARLGMVPKSTDLEHTEQLIKPLVAISQGGLSLDFPEGYGLKIATPIENPELVFGAQLQNPADEKNVKVTVKATIQYRDADDGVKLLKPIRIGYEGDEHHHMKGVHAHGMFMVDPGLFDKEGPAKFKFPEGKDRVTIHYARAHLHAFAKYIELWDDTDHKSVWKAAATTNPKTMSLENMNHYSSTEGLTILKNHRYLWKTRYQNTSADAVDAMAYLHLFYN